MSMAGRIQQAIEEFRCLFGERDEEIGSIVLHLYHMEGEEVEAYICDPCTHRGIQ
jgi:hypothetical protein